MTAMVGHPRHLKIQEISAGADMWLITELSAVISFQPGSYRNQKNWITWRFFKTEKPILAQPEKPVFGFVFFGQEHLHL
jgi:hypothetical protein